MLDYRFKSHKYGTIGKNLTNAYLSTVDGLYSQKYSPRQSNVIYSRPVTQTHFVSAASTPNPQKTSFDMADDENGPEIINFSEITIPPISVEKSNSGLERKSTAAARRLIPKSPRATKSPDRASSNGQSLLWSKYNASRSHNATTSSNAFDAIVRPFSKKELSRSQLCHELQRVSSIMPGLQTTCSFTNSVDEMCALLPKSRHMEINDKRVVRPLQDNIRTGELLPDFPRYSNLGATHKQLPSRLTHLGLYKMFGLEEKCQQHQLQNLSVKLGRNISLRLNEQAPRRREQTTGFHSSIPFHNSKNVGELKVSMRHLPNLQEKSKPIIVKTANRATENNLSTDNIITSYNNPVPCPSMMDPNENLHSDVLLTAEDEENHQVASINELIDAEGDVGVVADNEKDANREDFESLEYKAPSRHNSAENRTDLPEQLLL